jgi:hypothetical protein
MPVRSVETGLEDASDGRFATARRSITNKALKYVA